MREKFLSDLRGYRDAYAPSDERLKSLLHGVRHLYYCILQLNLNLLTFLYILLH